MLPARDHQQFEKTVLSNGITVYTYQDTFPISCIELQFPIGSGHAISANSILPGSPHFLEHTQLIRSQKFPEAYSLDRALGIKAGNSNGATHPSKTVHWIDVPAGEQHFAIEAMIDRMFYPIFNEEDFAIERGVIANERGQNKFYPGKNKASQYYFRDFINDVLYPVEQIFGSDEDLSHMSVERIADLHTQVSQSDQIIALAVGNDNFDELKDRLAALPTKPLSLASSIAPTVWGRKDYHLVYFDTVAQPRLEVAWIHPRLSYEEYRGVCFIINLMVNSTHGPLYREFREEKGWTYGLDALCMIREHNLVAGFTFPVNSLEHIDYIRNCLAERITSALNDQELIENEVKRQIGIQVYNYQTAGSIVSSASTDIITHGCIYTETEFEQALKKMLDPAWRSYIVGTYFKSEDMGSVSFMPERRQR